MVKFTRRKKPFDEDADWVPLKGRPFKMKTGTRPPDTPEAPTVPEAKKEKLLYQQTHKQGTRDLRLLKLKELLLYQVPMHRV